MIASIAESTMAARRAWLASVRCSATSTFARGHHDARADHQHVGDERDGKQPRRIHAAHERHHVGEEQRADQDGAGADDRRVADQPSFD
jgi:hypothetical protein